MKNPRNILITGASSGLGAALAAHYAAPGITLHLQGRNAERLERTATICRQHGATTHIRLLDVTDSTGMESWLHAADATSPLDLIIANAGISAGSGQLGETASQVRQLFGTNINGVINTITPLIPAMTSRGRGQLAIVSSLAGIRALPSCPAYSASKACVRYYGESLRGWLSSKGVHVNTICPGYIHTPMTEVNDFPMPAAMSAEKAASIIARGLARNTPRISFPARLFLPLWWLACLPVRLTDPFFSRLPSKPSLEQLES